MSRAYPPPPPGFTEIPPPPAGFNVIDESQPSLADRQSAAKAAFEANQPESHLGVTLSAETLWNQLKERSGRMANAILNTAPEAATPNTGLLPGAIATSNPLVKPETLMSAAAAIRGAIAGAKPGISTSVPATILKAATRPAGNASASLAEWLGKVWSTGQDVPKFALPEAAAPSAEIPFTPPATRPAIFPGDVKAPVGPSTEIPFPTPAQWFQKQLDALPKPLGQQLTKDVKMWRLTPEERNALLTKAREATEQQQLEDQLTRSVKLRQQ